MKNLSFNFLKGRPKTTTRTTVDSLSSIPSMEGNHGSRTFEKRPYLSFFLFIGSRRGAGVKQILNYLKAEIKRSIEGSFMLPLVATKNVLICHLVFHFAALVYCVRMFSCGLRLIIANLLTLSLVKCFYLFRLFIFWLLHTIFLLRLQLRC